MKPGFTMAEAVEIGKKIKMRQDRISHLKKEIERLNDCILIMEHECLELIQE